MQPTLIKVENSLCIRGGIRIRRFYALIGFAEPINTEAISSMLKEFEEAAFINGVQVKGYSILLDKKRVIICLAPAKDCKFNRQLLEMQIRRVCSFSG